jgi:hypothetical protein
MDEMRTDAREKVESASGIGPGRRTTATILSVAVIFCFPLDR